MEGKNLSANEIEHPQASVQYKIAICDDEPICIEKIRRILPDE